MIRIEHLNKTYDAGKKHENRVLKDISLTLPETGMVCILGPSGSGKTTLLNAAGGIDRFESGSVFVGEEELKSGSTGKNDRIRKENFGYIFQNYYLLNSHSVRYNVYMGLHSVDMPYREKLKRVDAALRLVGMEQYKKRNVTELSGGQKQRVSIARALVSTPQVIFADEPTGNLDEENTISICSLLKTISKDTLVVMVTHEERLADFFADRIIRVQDGRILSDEAGDANSTLSLSEGLYEEEFEKQTVEMEQAKVSVYTSEDAKPVSIRIVSMRDRIIIKTSDARLVLCSDEKDSPVLNAGARPVYTKENFESGKELHLPRPENRSGKLSFKEKFREALYFMKEKSFYQAGLLLFLLTVTVLSCIIFSDYLTVASIDPHQFITTDSHMLEINIERNENTPATFYTADMPKIFMEFMNQYSDEFEFVPAVAEQAFFTSEQFMQLSNIHDSFGGFSYVTSDKLSEEQLIYGHMPEGPEEVVIDRWILDNYMKKDGVLNNLVPDITYFLNKQMTFSKKNYTPKIVGISDSGECAVYIPQEGLIALGVNGQEVITVSDYNKIFGETEGPIKLEENSVIAICNNLGIQYQSRVGNLYRTKNDLEYNLQDAIFSETYAGIIVPDGDLDAIRNSMIANRMYFYCKDKARVKQIITEEMPEELKDMLRVQVTDAYSDAMVRYTKASQMKADARRILTVTVMLISLVMLYLFRRSQIRKRLDTIAVYRLLSVKKSVLPEMFCMEAVLSVVITAVPAAALTFIVFEVLRHLKTLEFHMIFGIRDALFIACAVLIYMLIISVLPALSLLLKPPTVIAREIS